VNGIPKCPETRRWETDAVPDLNILKYLQEQEEAAIQSRRCPTQTENKNLRKPGLPCCRLSVFVFWQCKHPVVAFSFPSPRLQWDSQKLHWCGSTRHINADLCAKWVGVWQSMQVGTRGDLCVRVFKHKILAWHSVYSQFGSEMSILLIVGSEERLWSEREKCFASKARHLCLHIRIRCFVTKCDKGSLQKKINRKKQEIRECLSDLTDIPNWKRRPPGVSEQTLPDTCITSIPHEYYVT